MNRSAQGEPKVQKQLGTFWNILEHEVEGAGWGRGGMEGLELKQQIRFKELTGAFSF